MACDQIKIFVNTDMVLEVANLRNTLTDVLVTGADVDAVVLDSLASPVSGVSNPLPLTEVVGLDGMYRGTIPNTADIDEGDTGTIVITANGGVGLVGEWTLEWIAVLRGE